MTFEAGNGGGELSDDDSFAPLFKIYDIFFSNVLNNTGNGYSTSRGEFNAPFSGMYRFSAKMCDNTTNTISIRANGNTLVERDIKTSNRTVCVTLTCLTDLYKGDGVYVYASRMFHRIARSTINVFSGHLIP